MVLGHWNSSLWVDMSFHSDTLFRFRANQSLLLLLNAAFLVRKQHIYFVVFSLTRSGLEPTIYHARGEHTNHYITDLVAHLNNIIIIKPKLISHSKLTLVYWLYPFVFMVPKILKLFGFLIFRFWTCLMKVLSETRIAQ